MNGKLHQVSTLIWLNRDTGNVGRGWQIVETYSERPRSR